MERVIRRISAVLLVFSMVAITLILAIVVLDVASRAVRGASLPGALEITEITLPLAAVLAMAYTQRQRGHVESTLLTDRLPPRAAAAVRCIGLILASALLLFMTYKTFTVALDSFASRESRFGLLLVPIWPVRFAISLGLAALALEVALSAVTSAKTVLGRAGPADRFEAASPPPVGHVQI